MQRSRAMPDDNVFPSPETRDEIEREARRKSHAANDAKKAGAPPIPEDTCGVQLECGSTCFLPPGHPPPCLCIGDDFGEPDTCPA